MFPPWYTILNACKSFRKNHHKSPSSLPATTAASPSSTPAAAAVSMPAGSAKAATAEAGSGTAWSRSTHHAAAVVAVVVGLHDNRAGAVARTAVATSVSSASRQAEAHLVLFVKVG